MFSYIVFGSSSRQEPPSAVPAYALRLFQSGGIKHEISCAEHSLRTFLVSQRAPGLKKINLERRSWKNQAFNTEWNFQSRMKFSFQAPLWPQKNRAWDWITENENFKRAWKFRAWGNDFFMRSSENEFFRSPGPLGSAYVTVRLLDPFFAMSLWGEREYSDKHLMEGSTQHPWEKQYCRDHSDSGYGANRALVIVLESRQFLRLWNAFKNSLFEASELVSTTTPITKAP